MKTVFAMAVLAISAAAGWAAEPAQPFRAARSVHLGFRAPDALLFYNEMTVLESTPDPLAAN